MTTYRSDILNNSILSTNRLLNENDQLTAKYNQYKRNLMNSQLITNTNTSSFNNEIEAGNNYLNNNLPDNDSDMKYTQLKRAYDERLISLYNQIKLIVKRIQADEVISNSKDKDQITERLKEIIDEELIKEKEEVLRRLSEENAEFRLKFATLSNQIAAIGKMKKLKEEYEDKIKYLEEQLSQAEYENKILKNQIQSANIQILNYQQGYDMDLKNFHDDYITQISKSSNDLQKLKSENDLYKDQISFYESKLKEISEEYEENKLEMDRLQKVISVLEIDLNSSETKLKEKQSRIEGMQSDFSTLQTQFFEANLKFKKIFEDNRSLQNQLENYEKERKEILEKYTQFSNELSKSQSEKFNNIERDYKDTIQTLKTKIGELNLTIEKLEDEIKKERNNSLNIKISYSKLYTNIQEDMKMIKTEWEKRLIDQQKGFDNVVNEIENKNKIEIEKLNHEHFSEIDKINRDLIKYKQSADLLKNFEKEYISIPNHEEILSHKIEEMRKKLEKEMKLNEQDIERELKRRLAKLEEDKQSEFEFLTENMRKTIKNLEKVSEEIKDENLKIRNDLIILRENNQNMENDLNNSQKVIKTLNLELNEKEMIINSLYERNSQNEENQNQLLITNKQMKSEIENICDEMNSLKKEKETYLRELKESEESFKLERIKSEKIFQVFKEKEEKKFQQEREINESLKFQIVQINSELEEFSNDNQYLNKRLRDSENELSEIKSNYDKLLRKLNANQEFISKLEVENSELTKQLKIFSFNQSNSKELIINFLKSKISLLKTEISQIKNFYKNEFTNVQKEHSKVIENLQHKIILFTNLIEKEFEKKMKIEKENFKISHESKQLEIKNEIKSIEQKYEKHLLDQFRINEKLEKEKKELIETLQNLNLKSKELQFKIEEEQSEMKNLNNQMIKYKLENDSLHKIIETLKLEKQNYERYKKENEDVKESSRRDNLKNVQNKISNIIILMNRMKKKYSAEIISLKNEIENLNNIHEVDKKNSLNHLQISNENLFQQIQELSEGQNSKENEILTIQMNLEKVREIYENKIQILNVKSEEVLKDSKLEIKKKNEHIKELVNNVHDIKSQFKMLKTQMGLKNDEVIKLKKEFDNLVKSKDKKISELQNIVNQSLYSYNTGVNNIKIANKLDDEVKILMKLAKIEHKENKK